jgi:hypothetical protein
MARQDACLPFSSVSANTDSEAEDVSLVEDRRSQTDLSSAVFTPLRDDGAYALVDYDG